MKIRVPGRELVSALLQTTEKVDEEVKVTRDKRKNIFEQSF